MAVNKKKINPETGLTDFEEEFVNLLFTNGFVASKAHAILKPNLTPMSNNTESTKLFRKPHIQKAIEIRKGKLRQEESIELSYLIKELKTIINEIKPYDPVEYSNDGNRVINKKDYKSMIAAINTLAKLGGYDNQTQRIEIENVNETPQEITININKSKK